MNKSESIMVSLKAISKTLYRVGRTDFYYFKSAVKAYVIDGVYGDIYSVTLKGGHLAHEGEVLYHVRKSGGRLPIVDAKNMLYDFDVLTDCEHIRGRKNRYKYLTLGPAGFLAKIYSHDIMGLCIYGDEYFDMLKDGNVMDHVSQVDKLNNSFINLESVTRKANSIRNVVHRSESGVA